MKKIFILIMAFSLSACSFQSKKEFEAEQKKSNESYDFPEIEYIKKDEDDSEDLENEEKIDSNS